MSRYAEVVFPLPLARSFTYLLPVQAQARVRIGCRVLAPFGPRLLTGFIVHLRNAPPKSAGTVKEIKALLDEGWVFPPRFLAFSRLLSRRYASSWGEFLAASVPPSFLPRASSKFRLTDRGESARGEGSLAGEEKRLAETLGGAVYSARFLKKKLSGNVSALLARMKAKGFVKEVASGAPRRRMRPPPLPAALRQLALDFPSPPGLEKVCEDIIRSEPDKRSGFFYLFGSRRSRETVYETLTQAVWKKSGRVLFLMPDISLAVDFLKKYEGLHPGSVAVLHSRLTARQKEEQWSRIRSGQVRVVAGPRSALFIPLPGLRLVLVDEEQDDSFYQAESPSYDARHAAVLLGRALGASVIFGSAHPSVESFYDAEAGGRLVRLDPEPPPPRVKLVDVRRERGYLSRELIEAIETRARRGERMIVFLNRRGYASAMVCTRCGRIPRCERCDIPLFFLKQRDSFVCRYCSVMRPARRDCPDCGGPLRLGREAGGEAVREELKRIFPRLRIAAFNSDTVRSESAQSRLLEQFLRGRVNLLVGTQLLAARRHVPPASLVAVLSPESQLGVPDYRSGQRTYHTLCRMMSFAQGPGCEVLIQTAVPDHHALAAAAQGDFESFYRTEVEFRRIMNYPPFSHLAEVFFEGRDLRRLARQARDFRERASRAGGGAEVQGPSRTYGPRRRGWERLVVMLRAARRDDLLAVLDSALRPTRAAKSVQILP